MKKAVNQLLESTNIKKNDNDLLDVIIYLMEESKVNKLQTKTSLNEFISRLILLTNNDFEEFIEKYEKTGVLVSIEIDNQQFDLKVEDFLSYIGLCSNKNEFFNFDGTQIQFLSNYKPFRYFKLKTNLKKPKINHSFLTQVKLKVSEITDIIDDSIFNELNSNCPAEKTHLFECKDFEQMFSFYGSSELSVDDYLTILEYLLNKTDYNHFKNDTDEAYTDEMFEKIDLADEIISIGYAVKNGIISPKAIIGKIDYNSNPFYEINQFRLIDDLINESSFETILQKWSFDKWKDQLPIEEQTL